MIAFDTNLLVRVAVADDPAQVAIVRELIERDTIFLSRTVLLETEWVLRAVYRKTRPEILDFMRSLLEIGDTEVESADQVGRALDWYGLGADFADALHLSACGRALMHTFHRGYCKEARAAGIAPAVRVLPVPGAGR
jgi:predicted nucleic-acid-binding protein